MSETNKFISNSVFINAGIEANLTGRNNASVHSNTAHLHNPV